MSAFVGFPVVVVLLIGGILVIIVNVSGLRSRWEAEHEFEEDIRRQQTGGEGQSDAESVDGRVIARHLHALADHLDAQKKQDRKQDKERAFREKVTIGALIFAGVAGGLSAWFLWVQLGDARIAADQQHRDTLAALAQTAEANIQATRQANIAENAQRAWIAPVTASQIPEDSLKAGTAFRFSVDYRNTGREPALDVNTYPIYGVHMSLPSEWKSGKWADFRTGPNETCANLPTVKGGPVIYPSSEFTVYHIYGTVNDEDTMAMAVTQDTVLVVKGCIVYETRGIRRESAYCFYLKPIDGEPSGKWTFIICNEGNHAS